MDRIEIIHYLTSLSDDEFKRLLIDVEIERGPSPIFPAVTAYGVPDIDGEDEKIFDVVITGYGDKKLLAKELREITGLPASEIFGHLKSLPYQFKKDVWGFEARELKKKLESATATVELV